MATRSHFVRNITEYDKIQLGALVQKKSVSGTYPWVQNIINPAIGSHAQKQWYAWQKGEHFADNKIEIELYVVYIESIPAVWTIYTMQQQYLLE